MPAAQQGFKSRLVLCTYSFPFQQPGVCVCGQLCLNLCDPMDCSLPAPLSLELSRQEYWSGLPLPPLGIFLPRGLNLHLLCLRHCQAEVFFKPLSHLGSSSNQVQVRISPELSETSRWKEINHHKEESPSPNKQGIYLGLSCEWKINLLCILRSICYGKWHYPN